MVLLVFARWLLDAYLPTDDGPPSVVTPPSGANFRGGDNGCIGVNCTGNGTRVTGLSVSLTGAATAIHLPSGDRLALH